MSTDSGFVVSNQFLEAQHAALLAFGELGSRELSPVETALFEYVSDLWSATSHAILQIETRLGPTAANPAGRAALKAFLDSKGIDSSRLS